MPRKRVNKTTNQLLWDKQIKRIKQFIHRAEKRGYIFDTSALPKKPKRVTKKALQRLQELKPKELYKFSKYVNPVTHEQTTGVQGRKLEIKKRTEKIQATKQARKISKPTSPIKEITITEDAFKEKSSIKEITITEDDFKEKSPIKEITITEDDFKDNNSSTTNINTSVDYETDNYEEHQGYEDFTDYSDVDYSELPTSSSTNYEPQYSDLPTFSYVVIENIRDEIRQWTPGRNWSAYWTEIKRNDKNVLETLLETTINNDDENVVATRLQNSASDIDRIVQSILYNSDREQVQLDIVEFATIIKGRALSIEESSILTEIQETQETEF